MNILPAPSYEVEYGELTEQSKADIKAWVFDNLGRLVDFAGGRHTDEVSKARERLTDELIEFLGQTGCSQAIPFA